MLSDSSCAPAHNHSDSIRTIAPASFKRMLDGAPCPDARARRAPHQSSPFHHPGSAFGAAAALMAVRGAPAT